MDINELIKEYKKYLTIDRGRSPKTVDLYIRFIKRFINTEDILSVSEIDLSRVTKFRRFLSEQSLTKKTQNHYLIAIRGLLKYCAHHDIPAMPADKIELASERDEEKKLDLIKFDQFLEIADIKDTDRDKAIIELLFFTGLRVSELIGLNIQDIDLSYDSFQVKGKGGKIRLVFISNRANEALRKYIKARPVILVN